MVSCEDVAVSWDVELDVGIAWRRGMRSAALGSWGGAGGEEERFAAVMAPTGEEYT